MYSVKCFRKKERSKRYVKNKNKIARCHDKVSNIIIKDLTEGYLGKVTFDE